MKLACPQLASTLGCTPLTPPHCHAVNDDEVKGAFKTHACAEKMSSLQINHKRVIWVLLTATSEGPKWRKCSFQPVSQCLQVWMFVFWMKRDDLWGLSMLLLRVLCLFQPWSPEAVPGEDNVCGCPVGPSKKKVLINTSTSWTKQLNFISSFLSSFLSLRHKCCDFHVSSSPYCPSCQQLYIYISGGFHSPVRGSQWCGSTQRHSQQQQNGSVHNLHTALACGRKKHEENILSWHTQSQQTLCTTPNKWWVRGTTWNLLPRKSQNLKSPKSLAGGWMPKSVTSHSFWTFIVWGGVSETWSLYCQKNSRARDWSAVVEVSFFIYKSCDSDLNKL